MAHVPVTGVERFFEPNEVIVSKTDLKGRITYANRVFMRVAGYQEHEVLGQPHSLVRHPDMPRCVFKLLWDTISSGRECFAYVVNLAKNGDHYWVFAHVTPSFDTSGNIVGYHSSRRVANQAIVRDKVVPLYRMLLDEEERLGGGKDAMNAAYQKVVDLLGQNRMEYNEWIFSL